VINSGPKNNTTIQQQQAHQKKKLNATIVTQTTNLQQSLSKKPSTMLSIVLDCGGKM